MVEVEKRRLERRGRKREEEVKGKRRWWWRERCEGGTGAEKKENEGRG